VQGVNRAQLLLWLEQRPFLPFRVVMTDGGVLDIWHPDQLIVSKTIAVVGRRATAQVVAERDVTNSLLHVIRLEPLD
jgi:hypothetical protein